MAPYKEKLAEDLERWIAEGHVAPDKREAILASVPDTRRLDAGAAIAWVGAVLLGVSLIAFIAANWDVMPRLIKFALLVAAYGASAGAGAWMLRAGREQIANGLLTIAAFVFAATIGLSGQIFDITGHPPTAFHMAGVAAAALALAGRVSGPAIAALILLGVGDFSDQPWWMGEPKGFSLPWLLIAAPAGAALALNWRSVPLAHASSLAAIATGIWIAARFEMEFEGAVLISFGLALLAYAGRWLAYSGKALGNVFFGWMSWGALGFFAAAAVTWPEAGEIIHRVIWLALAGGLVAVGRHDNHNLVTAAGVVGLIGAIAAILFDLGLDLMAAAGLFFVSALAALIGAMVLRRRAAA
jgi:uncharacterized membrane protein